MSDSESSESALSVEEGKEANETSSSTSDSSSESEEDLGQFIRRPEGYQTPEKSDENFSQNGSAKTMRESVSESDVTTSPTLTDHTKRKRQAASRRARESSKLERKLKEVKARYNRLLAQKAQHRNRQVGRGFKPERSSNPKSLAERIRGWQVSELEVHQEAGAQFHAWVTFKTTFQTNLKLYGIEDEAEQLMCLRAKGGRAITNILATVDKEDLTFREAWNSLENQFSSPIDKGTETANFYGMSQKLEEDIFNFFERVTKQARLCGFSQGDFAKNVGENFARKCLNPGYFLAAFDKFEDLDKLKSHARNFHLAMQPQSKVEAVLEVSTSTKRARDEDFNRRRDYREYSKRPRGESTYDHKPSKRFRTESPVNQGRDSKGDRRECRYCGSYCEKGKCPAFGKKCGYCQKWNHYEQTCRSKKFASRAPREPINSIADVKKQVNDEEWSA